ncbi:DUF2637 domain-containing protein [Streptomyces sp. BYX5S]
MELNGRITLVLALMVVVLMAFRVSWNALKDVARAIGADSWAALFYPIVIDGLMALALVATLVLTGTDRKYALRVLGAYTVASLLLNYVHGLVPALHTASARWGRLADWAPANYALVLLATSLPVGSIYFGSDLVAKVLHHTPESADSAAVASVHSVGQQADESAGQHIGKQAVQSPSNQAEAPQVQPTASTPVKAAAAHATGPTEADGSAPSARPARSAAVAESARVTPRRATGRVPSAAKSTVDRTRTDAEVLNEARRLTADWSDDQLTAERLRSELRIGQDRSRALRNQLQADRTGQTEPVPRDGSEDELAGELGEASSQQQKAQGAAPVDIA